MEIIIGIVVAYFGEGVFPLVLLPVITPVDSFAKTKLKYH